MLDNFYREHFLEVVQNTLAEGVTNSEVIFGRIEGQGYKGGKTTVKSYIAEHAAKCLPAASALVGTQEPRLRRPGWDREDAPGPGLREGMLPERVQDILPESHRAARQAEECGGFWEHVAHRGDAGEAVVPDRRRGRPLHVR